MRRIYFPMTLMVFAMMTACQESLEERCEREAKTYTEKKCPARIDENTTIDSMDFDRTTHTMSYYYTLGGPADNKGALSKVNPRKVLLEGLRNSTETKTCKDAGYNFRYVYRSKSNPEQTLFEVTFTEKDYR